MAASASPIDIATPRNSPPVQTSNLTSQLQAAGPQNKQISMSSITDARRGSELRPESYTNTYGSSFHSRPISMGDRQRRGSNNLAGSLMNGMSWGGLSVGSFIRDDILMTGTSPYNFQSPSFHSSSYLPKMEANFMKDYSCCGITLDSLHELLQHYEEAHAQVPNQTMGRTPKDQQQYSDVRTEEAQNAAAIYQQQQSQQQSMEFTNAHMQNNGSANRDPLNPHQDMDDLDAMEMDDSSTAPAVQSPSHQYQPQPNFGRQQSRMPQINTTMSNLQGSGTSTPSTPQGNQSFNMSNNPTVSSVNIPTFGQTAGSASQPRTPDESEYDYSNVTTPRMGNDGGIDFLNFNLGNDMSSGTIDEPAKRLLSKQGFGGIKTGMPNSQFATTSELAKRLRDQQAMQGFGAAGLAGFGSEEVKPFKCPVIGCEKAYKNQNGLKYHKQHGHQNQQLKENPDGTFSIVDPATSIPYPGTVGMEKEKPYRCEVCGKRYKNLNGLKYHRQHSPPCNPDLKLNPSAVPGIPNNMNAMNVNVAGAGLVGDGLGF